MLTNVPAQLLALLGTEAAMAPVLVGHAFLPAILHVLVSPEFALLLSLDAPGGFARPRLGMRRHAHHRCCKNACEKCQGLHIIILSLIGQAFTPGSR